MNVFRTAAALACAAVLAGCLPVTTKTPVGTTAGLGADSALAGTWKASKTGGEKAEGGYMHFLKAKDGTLTAVMIDTTDEGSWSVFKVRTAALGLNRIINAVETFDKDEPVEGGLKNANIPLLYVLSGRTLKLFLLDEEKTKQAVKAGKLKGEIEPGENGDVVITADAAELDAFFATPEAAALFGGEPMVMKKTD